jgi:hypothetical protein
MLIILVIGLGELFKSKRFCALIFSTYSFYTSISYSVQCTGPKPFGGRGTLGRGLGHYDLRPNLSCALVQVAKVLIMELEIKASTGQKSSSRPRANQE